MFSVIHLVAVSLAVLDIFVNGVEAVNVDPALLVDRQPLVTLQTFKDGYAYTYNKISVNNWKDRNCMNHESCVNTGNCCVEVLDGDWYELISQNWTGFSCWEFVITISTDPDEERTTEYFTVIDACYKPIPVDPSIIEKCEKLATNKDELDMVFIKPYFYKNKYCAECNGEDLYHFYPDNRDCYPFQTEYLKSLSPEEKFATFRDKCKRTFINLAIEKWSFYQDNYYFDTGELYNNIDRCKQSPRYDKAMINTEADLQEWACGITSDFNVCEKTESNFICAVNSRLSCQTSEAVDAPMYYDDYYYYFYNDMSPIENLLIYNSQYPVGMQLLTTTEWVRITEVCGFDPIFTEIKTGVVVCDIATCLKNSVYVGPLKMCLDPRNVTELAITVTGSSMDKLRQIQDACRIRNELCQYLMSLISFQNNNFDSDFIMYKKTNPKSDILITILSDISEFDALKIQFAKGFTYQNDIFYRQGLTASFTSNGKSGERGLLFNKVTHPANGASPIESFVLDEMIDTCFSQKIYYITIETNTDDILSYFNTQSTGIFVEIVGDFVVVWDCPPKILHKYIPLKQNNSLANNLVDNTCLLEDDLCSTQSDCVLNNDCCLSSIDEDWPVLARQTEFPITCTPIITDYTSEFILTTFAIVTSCPTTNSASSTCKSTTNMPLILGKEYPPRLYANEYCAQCHDETEHTTIIEIRVCQDASIILDPKTPLPIKQLKFYSSECTQVLNDEIIEMSLKDTEFVSIKSLRTCQNQIEDHNSINNETQLFDWLCTVYRGPQCGKYNNYFCSLNNGEPCSGPCTFNNVPANSVPSYTIVMNATVYNPGRLEQNQFSTFADFLFIFNICNGETIQTADTIEYCQIQFCQFPSAYYIIRNECIDPRSVLELTITIPFDAKSGIQPVIQEMFYLCDILELDMTCAHIIQMLNNSKANDRVHFGLYDIDKETRHDTNVIQIIYYFQNKQEIELRKNQLIQLMKSVISQLDIMIAVQDSSSYLLGTFSETASPINLVQYNVLNKTITSSEKFVNNVCGYQVYYLLNNADEEDTILSTFKNHTHISNIFLDAKNKLIYVSNCSNFQNLTWKYTPIVQMKESGLHVLNIIHNDMGCLLNPLHCQTFPNCAIYGTCCPLFLNSEWSRILQNIPTAEEELTSCQKFVTQVEPVVIYEYFSVITRCPKDTDLVAANKCLNSQNIPGYYPYVIDTSSSKIYANEFCFICNQPPPAKVNNFIPVAFYCTDSGKEAILDFKSSTNTISTTLGTSCVPVLNSFGGLLDTILNENKRCEKRHLLTEALVNSTFSANKTYIETETHLLDWLCNSMIDIPCENDPSLKNIFCAIKHNVSCSSCSLPTRPDYNHNLPGSIIILPQDVLGRPSRVLYDTLSNFRRIQSNCVKNTLVVENNLEFCLLGSCDAGTVWSFVEKKCIDPLTSTVVVIKVKIDELNPLSNFLNICNSLEIPVCNSVYQITEYEEIKTYSSDKSIVYYIIIAKSMFSLAEVRFIRTFDMVMLSNLYSNFLINSLFSKLPNNTFYTVTVYKSNVLPTAYKEVSVLESALFTPATLDTVEKVVNPLMSMIIEKSRSYNVQLCNVSVYSLFPLDSNPINFPDSSGGILSIDGNTAYVKKCPILNTFYETHFPIGMQDLDSKCTPDFSSFCYMDTRCMVAGDCCLIHLLINWPQLLNISSQPEYQCIDYVTHFEMDHISKIESFLTVQDCPEGTDPELRDKCIDVNFEYDVNLTQYIDSDSRVLYKNYFCMMCSNSQILSAKVFHLRPGFICPPDIQKRLNRVDITDVQIRRLLVTNCSRIIKNDLVNLEDGFSEVTIDHLRKCQFVSEIPISNNVVVESDWYDWMCQMTMKISMGCKHSPSNVFCEMNDDLNCQCNVSSETSAFGNLPADTSYLVDIIAAREVLLDVCKDKTYQLTSSGLPYCQLNSCSAGTVYEDYSNKCIPANSSFTLKITIFSTAIATVKEVASRVSVLLGLPVTTDIDILLTTLSNKNLIKTNYLITSVTHSNKHVICVTLFFSNSEMQSLFYTEVKGLASSELAQIATIMFSVELTSSLSMSFSAEQNVNGTLVSGIQDTSLDVTQSIFNVTSGVLKSSVSKIKREVIQRCQFRIYHFFDPIFDQNPIRQKLSDPLYNGSFYYTFLDERVYVWKCPPRVVKPKPLKSFSDMNVTSFSVTLFFYIFSFSITAFLWT